LAAKAFGAHHSYFCKTAVARNSSVLSSLPMGGGKEGKKEEHHKKKKRRRS